ncbi:hypothetical protein OAB57_00125 [Bacteriovoracaceae bacterium]|nr:hypothetical protein [Bacteriovoracaceae bacterium]
MICLRYMIIIMVSIQLCHGGRFNSDRKNKEKSTSEELVAKMNTGLSGSREVKAVGYGDDEWSKIYGPSIKKDKLIFYVTAAIFAFAIIGNIGSLTNFDMVEDAQNYNETAIKDDAIDVAKYRRIYVQIIGTLIPLIGQLANNMLKIKEVCTGQDYPTSIGAKKSIAHTFFSTNMLSWAQVANRLGLHNTHDQINVIANSFGAFLKIIQGLEPYLPEVKKGLGKGRSLKEILKNNKNLKIALLAAETAISGVLVGNTAYRVLAENYADIFPEYQVGTGTLVFPLITTIVGTLFQGGAALTYRSIMLSNENLFKAGTKFGILSFLINQSADWAVGSIFLSMISIDPNKFDGQTAPGILTSAALGTIFVSLAKNKIKGPNFTQKVKSERKKLNNSTAPSSSGKNSKSKGTGSKISSNGHVSGTRDMISRVLSRTISNPSMVSKTSKGSKRDEKPQIFDIVKQEWRDMTQLEIDRDI